MRTLRILAISAIAIVSAAAESAQRSVPTANDWVGVPTIPLQPPAMAAPAPVTPPGNWSSTSGWRGAPRAMPAPGREWRSAPGARWGRWRGGDRHAFRHFRPRPGVFIPRFFVSPTFFVTDWYTYGLPQPGYGQNWVRYYDDAVLIDERGYIYDTAPGVDWEGDRSDEDYEYAGRWRPQTYHTPGVYYAPPGSTTVIVQGPPVVTTTTTTSYVDDYVPARRRAWRSGRKCPCK